ncbi:hypothetical protein D3C78_1340700 [compost metagenome]
MIAAILCLVGQIVGIDADAMTAYQARLEVQKVPLRPSSTQHCVRIDIHFVKEHRQLVHKSNINITLRILDYLGCLRHLQAIRAVNTRFDNQLIQAGYKLQRFSIIAGHDFYDIFQTMNFISRINPFRRIAHLEILSAGKP